MNRADCLALDEQDGLAPLRQRFDLPDGTIYLDGNSLGALPRSTAERMQQVVREEWGRGLIRSWNSAGWMDLPRHVGDKIGRLVGARPGEVVVADSTSVNLFKVLTSALDLQRAKAQRRRVVSERHNFPTDLYIAESLARERGLNLQLLDADDIAPALDDDVAVLMLTHVNYRSGRMHDMAALTARAHAAGALAVWDLAHSAGAVPLDLHAADADFAVGCGYKYLNGGPGAPAFAWAHPRHTARMDAEQLWQPLSGWMGHAAPFEFAPHYRPALGMARFSCGTPPILAVAALEAGVDSVLAAEPLGGLAALREKSLALSGLFMRLVEERCDGHGLLVLTPREAALRGSQASLSRDEGAYAIVQALIARGVIGDFRAATGGAGAEARDILRFGFTPLYTRFVDVWDAVEQLRQVMESGEWREARFHQRAAVT